MFNKKTLEITNLYSNFSFGGSTTWINAEFAKDDYNNADQSYISSQNGALPWVYAGIASITNSVVTASVRLFARFRDYSNHVTIVTDEGVTKTLSGDLNYVVPAFGGYTATTITSNNVLVGDTTNLDSDGTGGTNGFEDALRHAILFGETARFHGKTQAFNAAVFNENKPGNFDGSTTLQPAVMDMFNNRIGILAGDGASSFLDVQEKIENKLYAHELYVMPVKQWEKRYDDYHND